MRRSSPDPPSVLAELDHAVRLQLGDDAIDRFGADAVVGKPGADARGFEERTRVRDGLVDTRVLIARAQAPHPLGVLQQLARFTSRRTSSRFGSTTASVCAWSRP